ncbi:MAG TPA: serine/threonine-protein kinase, partial [Steroidobacteraceae bacterium]|nr:serine/threonine-protein kinase [Steroidobacteraceae bacterium]
AFDPATNTDIALKILHPGASRSAAAWTALTHEHQSASRLDHPGILKVYPPERDGTTFLLPMELAAGGDLKRLRGASYLTIVPVLIEVARALQHAHERGVIHRDLKPGNVLFDERGRVKLADFGVSGNSLDPGTDAMVRGLSPFTASPEQLRGEPPRPADDVYGLGALAYELLSRYPPHYPHFDARRVQEDPVPAQQIPPQLASLVGTMLAKDPQRRPANMRDVIDELDASLNDTLTFDFDDEAPHGAAANETVPPAERLTLPPASPNAAPVAAAAPEVGKPEPQRPGPRPEPLKPEPFRAAAAPVLRPAVREPEPLTPGPMSAAVGAVDGAGIWEEVRGTPLRPPRFEPMRSGVPRALVVIAILAALAAGAYLYLPRWLPALLGARSNATPELAATVEATAEARLKADRILLEQRITALEARGASIWGGPDYANAKSEATQAASAHDPRGVVAAEEHVARAKGLLDNVEQAASAALDSELAAGDRALAERQRTLAVQAFDLAVRIAPQDARALAGQARARELPGGAAAATAGSPAPAPQAQPAAPASAPPAPAAANSPPPAAATAAPKGAALGQDDYARAAGAGFAALGAGRLDEARAAFQRARAANPNGAEAQDGLKRVDAAVRSRGFATLRSRAEDAEADERWEDALTAYGAILKSDPSQDFAQEGKARAQSRLDLDESLQALIDRPDLLASADARARAAALLQSAQSIDSPGPALRLQMARVSALLPEFEKPVHLTLVSDGFTQVQVVGVGTFGGFSRRDVELKPGHYTLIGTRDGYRDVRRDVSVSPGQTQTISVSCYELL